MAKKLTARSIEQAKRDPTKRIEIPDAGKPGLYLVVQPSGKKSWAVRYRRRSDGKPRKVTLEGFPSLAVAHKLAQTELDKAAEGRDPAAEKKATKKTLPTDGDSDLFGAVLDQFIRRHVERNTRASSANETKRLLGLRLDKETAKLVAAKGGLADKWGKRRIQEIGKRDILDLLNSIVDRGGGLFCQSHVGCRTQAVQLGASTRHHRRLAGCQHQGTPSRTLTRPHSYG